MNHGIQLRKLEFHGALSLITYNFYLKSFKITYRNNHDNVNTMARVVYSITLS